jgi:hypothetical protein
MVISVATRQQLQRVDDPAGLLVLLKLEHPAIETAYVVNDTRAWVLDGFTWVGLPFEFRLPSSVAGEAPRAVIQIDNVGRALTPSLESLPPYGVLLATFRVVSRATPTVIEYEFAAPLSNVSVTVTSVSASIGNDDALRAPAVKVRYDPKNSPGLFAG